MFDGLDFETLAGWQSGYAAVCNTVYAGSIPTPASINSSFVNHSVYESSKTRSYRLKTHGFLGVLANLGRAVLLSGLLTDK